MDENIKILLGIAGSVGLSQLVLFWVTRRSRKADTRDEKELTLESSYVAERRELLTTLRAQLIAEQTAHAGTRRENIQLMSQMFALQAATNEVVAKYNFLRSLNPEANLPAVNIDLAALCPNLPATAAEPPAKTEEGHDHP